MLFGSVINIIKGAKEKGKEVQNMLKEFKKFALRGNMIDLAVGMIIGSAFTSIVKSLVDDIFMPFISLFTGKVDFNNWFIALDGKTYATLEAAQEAGASTLNYGTFISNIINFVIMAFVVFLFVKGINKMHKEEPKAVTTKKCPFCKTEIDIEATKCPHCTSELEQ